MKDDRLINYVSGVGGGLYLASVISSLGLDTFALVRAGIVFLVAAIFYYRLYVRPQRQLPSPKNEPRRLTTIVEAVIVSKSAMTPSGEVPMCPFCPHPVHDQRCGAAVVYVGQSNREVVSRCKCRHDAKCKLNSECSHDVIVSDHDCNEYIKLLNIGAEIQNNERRTVLVVNCVKCNGVASEVILPQEATRNGAVLMQHWNSEQLLPTSLSKQLGLGEAVQREQFMLQQQ